MKPSRFVTWCFVYSGISLLASKTLFYSSGRTGAVIGNAGAALCIVFAGVYRLYSTEEEEKPETYGLFAYGMAVFALLSTFLFLAGIATRLR